MPSARPEISISIVSHGQGALVAALLADLAAHHGTATFEVLLTLNLSEDLPWDATQFSFPMTVICNPQPMGFGANHNQAFARARGTFFCVLNPDIRWQDDPFTALLDVLRDASVGIVAPRVANPAGQQEDSARRFPTPLAIACKALGLGRGSSYRIDQSAIEPDWAAGMFLLLPSSVYAGVGGFDTRYFLYYEDVDLSARLRLAGYRVVVTPAVTVVHVAQRASHRRVRYLVWHLSSMLRFFCSTPYWRTQWRKSVR